MELKDKQVLVAGMGKSGLAAMRVLKQEGARVFVYDKEDPKKVSDEIREEANNTAEGCYWGVLPEEERRFDFMVISPGIPLTEEIAGYGRSHCGELIGELELAYRLSKGSYIAITGTNGKTTTTSLVGEILKKAGRKTFVVGNIGEPVVYAAEKSDEETWFAAEVSSFQLETVREFHPVVSAMLNLTPDHLNRHGTFEEYGRAKANVYKNQTKEDYFIVNWDNKEGYQLAGGCPALVIPFSRKDELEEGCFVKDGRIVIRNLQDRDVDICGLEDIRIPGDHNVENVLAAAAMCYYAGVAPEDIARGIREFEGVEHRIEFVDEIGGVRYYNDSKGTNTDASRKALEALKENIILIAGGYDKKENMLPFAEDLKGRVRHLLLMGVTAPDIAKACDEAGFTDYSFRKDLEECMEAAYEMAQPGDIVLLSPACASWDMYPSYEVRGRHFKELVARLKTR